MRAAVYDPTDPDAPLTVVERDRPEPGAGEVLVGLVRAGVNPTDWKARGNGMNDAFTEVVPGQDGAGEIVALGEGVDGFAVGDRVWLHLAQHQRPGGTAAEFTVQPVARVAPLPEGASYDVGAALGVPALTAHRALTSGDVSRLGPGRLDGVTVLVTGGAGAVGNAAIQLAAWSGATVISTVSSEEKAALARAAGAHHVVDYRAEDVTGRVAELAPDGVDLVVDVALAANLADDVAVLRTGGTLAFYGADPDDHADLVVREGMSKNLRLQGILLYSVTADQLRAGVEDVTAAVAAGAFGVGDEAGLPLHHVDLADAAEAHALVRDGAVGKVLIDV